MIRYAKEMEESGIPALINKASRMEKALNGEKSDLDGILSSARRQTEPLDDVPVARDLEKETSFDFRRMKEDPVTVYVILPPKMMDRQKRWLRLLVTAALQAVMDRAPKEWEPSVLFMLDEFAVLGRLEVVFKNWAVVNGYGVQIMPVVQDFSQFRQIYGDKDWLTFVNNAGIVAAFGGNDMETARWFSKRGGERTEAVWSYNEGSREPQTSHQHWKQWQASKGYRSFRKENSITFHQEA